MVGHMQQHSHTHLEEQQAQHSDHIIEKLGSYQPVYHDLQGGLSLDDIASGPSAMLGPFLLRLNLG